MDSRQPNHEYPGSNPQRPGGTYAFNGSQNDAFSSFVHTENESAFETPWNSQPFPTTQQPVHGFDQGNHGWQQTPYSSSNLLSMPNYGIPSRDFEQSYSRSPAPFDYAGFDPANNQTFSPSPYDNTLAYGHISLNNSSSVQYDYPGQQGLQQQHHETISPQALQHYSTSFPQNIVEDSRQSQNFRYGSNMPVPRASNSEAAPFNQQDWIGLANSTAESICTKGLRIKPTAALSNATKSTRVDGFTFVGSGNLASSATKALVSRFKKRKPLKEFRRQLEFEKGTDPWHRDREHVLKKLKTTEQKLSGPRSAAPSHSYSMSKTESASPTESSDSDSDDDSDYSGSEVEVEREEPSPVPASRPVDPNKAVEYDVIKAVWAKKNMGLSSTVIRTALTEYWDIFKGIRDKWKARSTSLQQAIDKKDQANIKTYERRVLDQRRLLESCLRLTLKYGHPDIVEKLGENPGFLLVFYQFVADRFKDSEYTGSLIASILELMTKCVTIDQLILEKTKLDKVLPRIVKRGDDQGKQFAQQILDNAPNASKQKATGEPSVPGQHSNGTTAKTFSERPRGHDINGSQSSWSDAKKASSIANKGASTTKSAINPESRQSSVKTETKSAVKVTGIDTSGKVKANHITAKPSSFFSSLKSASKKPGTSAKLDDGRTSAGPEVKADAVAEPPKPAFSFAATMATLNAQKDVTPVKAEETRKPETAEEKRKRLRKEERRKLRVSFKADDVLVQIREFVHDPEEELGHEDSQVRDVGDSRGEGQMLKMHKDLELMDDDEDYEPPDEVLPDWYLPTGKHLRSLAPQFPADYPVVIDLCDLPANELEKNCTSRGGKAEIKGSEREIQNQRESNTLMVVYSTHSDIPPSPREPSDPYSGEQKEEESFGPPYEDYTKDREAQYYAYVNNQQTAAQPQAPDVNALLRIVNSLKQHQPPPPPPPPPVAAPPKNELEALVAQFAAATNQQQAQPMQLPQPVPPPVQQPTPSFGNLGAALAALGQSNQAQPVVGAPPPQIDLQAILAQMGTQPAPQVPQMPGYGFQNQYQNENDRKRQFEQDDVDYGHGKGKRTRGSGADKKKFQYHGPPRLPCKFWQEGKCRKGDECTFLHE